MNEQPNGAADANDPLLSQLNTEQRAAVLTTEGPLLVLAGAGSGKTRVIVHRVAWLVERLGVAPWQILAVTFTNKAAGEMRERIERLLGAGSAGVQVSTFHALGASLLRREASLIGRTPSFLIYDDSDQLKLIRRAMKELGIEDRPAAAELARRIDHAKNHAQLPEDLLAPSFDLASVNTKKVYARYQQLLRAADALDFGDLLLELVLLLRREPEVLARYRRRFRYLLVDEFQDTNPAQYELLNLLCPRDERANLCVVGDDDQSIYRWRGADVSNILSFERDHPGASVVKLEQNYRSGGRILEAAHEVIRKNRRRKEKKLWTSRGEGERLILMAAADERDEGRQIAARVRELSASGVERSQIAVFYRANAQSRALEEALRLGSVPYQVVRGRAFYERAEVKDAAAYLRLGINPRSDADLERVINSPARGIGNTTLERLRLHARGRSLSLFEALGEVELMGDELGSAARKRLAAFRALVEELARALAAAPSAEAGVEAMLERSGLVEALQAEGGDEALDRLENLREFAGAARQFDEQRAQRESPAVPEGAAIEAPSREEGPLQVGRGPVEEFLEQISLVGDADAELPEGRVSLMTLHAAKGLEFDVVFMTGMEEGVLPHSRALDPWSAEQGSLPSGAGGVSEELEEERRLCYVGITRARKRLHLSLALSRTLFGKLERHPPSRFLSDIPRNLFAATGPLEGGSAAVRLQTQARPPMQREFFQSERGETYVELDIEEQDGFLEEQFDQRPEAERRAAAAKGAGVNPGARGGSASEGPLLWPGSRVSHESFGEGRVLEVSGQGAKAMALVHFQRVGPKKILVRFLKSDG